MLEVSAQEFERSWHRQEQQAKNVKDNASRRMLLFYAVECGGKYHLMKRDGCHTFSKMPEAHMKYLHNIKAILKELGLEAKCDFPSVQSEYGETIRVEHYQEMWRYGINCKDAEEKGRYIEENLNKALELLKNMNGRGWR